MFACNMEQPFDRSGRGFQFCCHLSFAHIQEIALDDDGTLTGREIFQGFPYLPLKLSSLNLSFRTRCTVC